MVAAWKGGDEAGYFSYNRRIHEGIMAASRNGVLANIYESLSGRIQRSRYSAGRPRTNGPGPYRSTSA